MVKIDVKIKDDILGPPVVHMITSLRYLSFIGFDSTIPSGHLGRDC
jgi:hypothetical protein